MIRIFLKRKTIRLFTILTLFIFNASLSFAGQYKVTRVINGNTIRVISYGTKTTVRLVGIDAPEVAHSKNTPGQPFSEAAAKHLAGLVLNKTVEIKSYGPDRYGRMLAEVAVDDRNINIEMLKSGLQRSIERIPWLKFWIRKPTGKPKKRQEPLREECGARGII
jgi:endonuclease YncB( thermonuclease family)